MAFPQQPPINRVPTRIRKLEIRLVKTVDPDDPDYPEGIDYLYTVDDQHDQPMNHFPGNAIPHINAEVTSVAIPAGTSWLPVIEGFFNQMWAKAETEAIP